MFSEFACSVQPLSMFSNLAVVALLSYSVLRVLLVVWSPLQTLPVAAAAVGCSSPPPSKKNSGC